MATWFWAMVAVLATLVSVLAMIVWGVVRNNASEARATDRRKMREHELELARMQMAAHEVSVNGRPKGILGGFADTPDFVGGSVFHTPDPVIDEFDSSASTPLEARPGWKSRSEPMRPLDEPDFDNDDDRAGVTAEDVAAREIPKPRRPIRDNPQA